MMRKLHRWFGLITAIFMIVISSTGIAMQVVDLTGGEHHGGPRPGMALQGGANQPNQAQPTQAQPNPGSRAGGQGGQDGKGGTLNFRQLVNHIHTGEYFGPIGIYIDLLMGVTLFFFSVSGLWIYWQMFKGRAALGKKEVFW